MNCVFLHYIYTEKKLRYAVVFRRSGIEQRERDKKREIKITTNTYEKSFFFGSLKLNKEKVISRIHINDETVFFSPQYKRV